MAQSLTPANADLLVLITPRAYTRYYGTAAQLVAEGLVPDGFQWPSGDRSVSFEIGLFTHDLARCRPDGIKGPKSVWTSGDYWRLQRGVTAENGKGFYRAQIYEKSMELQQIIHCNTPEWNQLFCRAWEAQKDTKYQAFRLQVLGEPKRGRGRPAKAAASTQAKGATA